MSDEEKPDDSEPTPERQAELRAAYDANVASGKAPYEGVELRTRGELTWVMSERDWSGGYAAVSKANLSGARLPKVNLSGAFLAFADLSGAYLFGATLSGAFVREANLSGADLDGATLSDADLRGADLEAVTDLTLISGRLGVYQARATPTPRKCARRRSVPVLGTTEVMGRCSLGEVDNEIESFDPAGYRHAGTHLS